MGNDFGKTPFFSGLYAFDRHVNPHDRRMKKFPHYDERSEISKVVHYFKHCKAELQYFLYRAFVGAAVGGVLGVAMVNPLANYSPYVYRKVMMSIRPTEYLPIKYSRIVFGNFMPQYASAGAIIALLVEGSSWFYDAVFDTNKLTKYMVLGGLQGATVGLLFGNYGYWIGGTLMGFTAGCLLCYRPIHFYRSMGDFGSAAEYMPHVTDEEKRRYKLQEARLMR
jgi:hypothetical protein